MIQDPKAFNKIRKARTALILEHPFFASLALRLKVQEDFSCHTAWTDGSVFAYNPHYVNMLSTEKLEGMTAHIVMHPACNHHIRRNNRDQKTWNRACDYVINGILLDAGFTLPDGYLFREEYQDRSAEAVYDLLDVEEDKEELENEETVVDENEDNSGETLEQDEQEKGAEPDDKPDDKEQGPQDESDPGMSGEVRDGEGNGGFGEDNGEETEWDDAVIQAAINAKGIGKLPAALERMLNEKLEPELDWRELLNRFIEKNARSDYSWITPNKRYLHKNIYLPSLRNCELDHVVIGVDTSGSISDRELHQFEAEISEIFNQYPATIHLLYCDNRMQKVVELDRCDLPIKIEPQGGGGTDYRPVFQYLEDHDITPSCLIYLTDLECKSYPPYEPHYPVLWVKSGQGKIMPPFGEIINLQ